MRQSDLAVAEVALRPEGFKYFRKVCQCGDDWHLFCRRTPDHWPFSKKEIALEIRDLSDVVEYLRHPAPLIAHNHL